MSKLCLSHRAAAGCRWTLPDVFAYNYSRMEFTPERLVCSKIQCREILNVWVQTVGLFVIILLDSHLS